MYDHSYAGKLLLFLSAVFLLSFCSSSQEKLKLKPELKNEYQKNDDDFSVDSFDNDFKRQVSFGSGVSFFNDFRRAFWTVNFDIGFRTSKYFMLIPGVDFILYTEKPYIYEPEPESRLLYCVSFSPAFFIQTKQFMFIAGAGPQIILPLNFGSLNLIFLTRAAVKISSESAIGLSIKTAVRMNGDLDIPAASLMYTYVF